MSWNPGRGGPPACLGPSRLLVFATEYARRIDMAQEAEQTDKSKSVATSSESESDSRRDCCIVLDPCCCYYVDPCSCMPRYSCCC